MTIRSKEVLRNLISVLRNADGTPLDVAVIAIKLDMILSTPRASLKEIDFALRFAESAGWIEGATTEAGTQLWAITIKGRLAEI